MLAGNKGNMKLVTKEWSCNFNKPCNLSIIISYRSGHYDQLCFMLIFFLLSIHPWYWYFLWRELMLNNTTIKISDKILATMTSPQGDNVGNKILCFLYVWGFFSLVLQICISRWRMGMNANWKKGIDYARYFAFIFTILDPFFALIFVPELHYLVSLAFWHLGFNQ